MTAAVTPGLADMRRRHPGLRITAWNGVSPDTAAVFDGELCVWSGPIERVAECKWPTVDRIAINGGTFAQLKEAGEVVE